MPAIQNPGRNPLASGFIDNSSFINYCTLMPITRSAKKALRQSQRRRQRNLKRKEAYKKAAGEVKKTAATGTHEQATALIPGLYKALDKAAKTRAIHPNKAARLKSRISKKVATAQKNTIKP